MTDRKALTYMCLLSLQFGLQPTLTRNFTPDGVCRSTVVLMQEILKFFFALIMLKISGTEQSAVAGTFVLRYRILLSKSTDGIDLLLNS